MVGMIPIYIESERGHDTLFVSADKVNEKLEEELEKGKWVTTEMGDGSSKILTEVSDVKELAGLGAEEKTGEEKTGEEKTETPQTETETPQAQETPKQETEETKEEWGALGEKTKTGVDLKKANEVKSATITNKFKGG